MIESPAFVFYILYTTFPLLSRFIKQNCNKEWKAGIKCDLAQSFSKGPYIELPTQQ